MLPKYLANSYQRYKEDTLVFTTWLSKTAKKCGYTGQDIKRKDGDNSVPKNPGQETSAFKPPVPVVVGGRLKGKARVEAKKAAAMEAARVLKKENFRVPGPHTSHIPINDSSAQKVTSNTVTFIITTKDILYQAKVIAATSSSSTKHILLPKEVKFVAERAINARKRCAEWFAATDSDNTLSESNSGHNHFIQVMEEALEVLTHASFEADDTSTLSNRFGSLDVDDLPEDELFDIMAADISSSISASPRSKPSKSGKEKGSECDIYEWTPDNLEDFAFAVYCLFADLHHIRIFLRETWEKFSEGKLDYITASFITNSAIEIVRQQEGSIVKSNPALFTDKKNQQSPYNMISNVMITMDILKSDLDIKDFMKKKDWHSLKRYHVMDYLYLNEASGLHKYSLFPDEHGRCPRPVLPLDIEYLTKAEQLEEPEVKEAVKNDVFLTQLMFDGHCYDKLKVGMKEDIDQCPDLKGFKLPNHGALDMFQQAIQLAYLHGEVHTFAAFACKVILDVRKTLGPDYMRPYDLLQRDAKSGITSLKLEIVEKGIMCRDGSFTKRQMTSIVPAIYDLSRRWITDNIFAAGKEYCITNYNADPRKCECINISGLEDSQVKEQVIKEFGTGRVEAKDMTNVCPDLDSKIGIPQIDFIPPAQDPEFLLKNNPLFGGTTGLHFKTRLLECGLAMSNRILSIYAAAHLYTYARQSKLIPDDSIWRDMDQFITRHKATIFGSELPSTPREFHSRFLTRIGVSTTNWAATQRKGESPKGYFRKGALSLSENEIINAPCLIKMDPFNKALRNYATGETTLAKTLWELITIMRDENASTANHPPKHKSEKQDQQPPSVKFLAALRERVPLALESSGEEYILLTRTCTGLLSRIRDALFTKLGVEYPFVGKDNLYEVGFLNLIAGIFKSAWNLQQLVDDIPGGPSIRKAVKAKVPEEKQSVLAGQIIKDFIENGCKL